MNDQEFARWVWTSTLKDVSKGLLIYSIVLGIFWLTIG
jgi:hypothetical protein